MPSQEKHLDHVLDAHEEGIWNQFDLDERGRVYIGPLLMKLGLDYRDSCECRNCNIICNLVEGDPEARLRVVLEVSLD